MKVFCPNCGSNKALATIENHIEEWMYFNEIDEYGDVMWTGQSDFGDDVIVGVGCNMCQWEYRGEDWKTKLVKETH